MNNQRNLIIGAIVAVIIVIGVGLFFLTRGPETVPAGTVVAAPGAEIDPAVLLAADQGMPVHAMGSETAPVTVIEYASPTCPHCATFHNTVYPAFREQYIETGKVEFIVRPFVRNVLDSVIFMLAEAAGPDQFHNVIETYFRTQTQWADPSKKPRDEIEAIAKQLGFTDETFEAALTNQELFTAMEAMREEALTKFRLQGTPTFYINGKILTGDSSLAELAATIDPLIPAGFQPVAVDLPEPAVVVPTTTPAVEPAAPAGETFTPVTEPGASMSPVEPEATPMAAEPVEPVTPMAAEPVEPATPMAAEPVEPATPMAAEPVAPAAPAAQ